jgi:hypothetical protein
MFWITLLPTGGGVLSEMFLLCIFSHEKENARFGT